MASKRKPLDDARKRVNEKLDAIEEQKEFIQNSVHQLTAGVRKSANSLLGETSKTKFFNKYRAVSQELEKCLDDLLLISATISSLDDKDGESEEDDEEEAEEKDAGEAVVVKELQQVDKAVSETKELSVGDILPSSDGKPQSSDDKQLSCLPEDKQDVSQAEIPKPDKLNRPSDTRVTGTVLAKSKDSQSPECAAKPPVTNSTKNLSSTESVPAEPLKRVPSTRSFQFSKGYSLQNKVFKNQSSRDKCVEKGAVKHKNKESSSTLSPKDVPSSMSQTIEARERNAQKNSDNKGEDQVIEAKNIKQDLATMSCKSEREFSDSSKVPLNIDCFDPKCHEGDKSSKPEMVVPSEVSEKMQNKGIAANSEAPKVLPEEENKAPPSIHKSQSPTEVFAGDVLEEALKVNSTKANRKKGLQIPPFKFPENHCLEVAVTEIVSPCEFWIQQTNGDLDLLMEEMCIFFSKLAKVGDKGGMNEMPVVGDVCCARFTDDNIWYRALVTTVYRDTATVEVLYVDEGNRETLPLSRLRPIDARFRQLPRQALCCEMSGVQLSKEAKIEEVSDWFKRRVSGETLEAVLAEKSFDTDAVSPVPIHLYIRPPGSTSCSSPQKLEYDIHEMMIREGFSQRAESPKSPEASSSASPPSSHSDLQSLAKAESVESSSTTTSGFYEAPICSPDTMKCADQYGTYNVDQRTVVAKAPGCLGNTSNRRVPPPAIHLDSDGSLFMLVSHVVNPGEFYVHCITSDAGKLDTLMTEMNRVYNEEAGNGVNDSSTGYFSPRVGDFCCAKFTSDGSWYRALVLQVRHSLNERADGVDDSGKKSTIRVEVFYVDFGNTENVGVEHLRELLPCFVELPAQVVRCSLADVEPRANSNEIPVDVFPDSSSLRSVSSRNRSKPSTQRTRHRSAPTERSRRDAARKTRSRQAGYHNAIEIAAGDEDPHDDVFDSFFMLRDPSEKVRSRSSISEDIEKRHRTPSLLSDTAVELFEKVWSGAVPPSVTTSWSTEATEYFDSLTKNAQKLVGFVVPWDSEMVNSIVNYCQDVECSLPNLGPVLRLNLYDVSGDEDVFINGAMVKANFALSATIAREANFGYDVSINMVEQAREELSLDAPIVKMNQQELADMALSLQDTKQSPPESTTPSCTSSPKSPTLHLMEAWNPMSNDYKSYRNTYNVQTENLDVAILGYEEDRGKICPYYRSKHGCFQGSNCPNKHVQQDLTGKVCIYGAQSFMSVVLPEVGTWVAARVTAVYNPAHFWVQLPFGRESLDSQIIKRRSGKETTGEENLKDLEDLMEKMSEFYSKTFRRERSLVPAAGGEIVALRYTKDNQWYRGKVCQEKDGQYQVWFVDYGFSEWIDKSDVYPMVPHFLHVAFQAVECFLANIKPKCGPLSVNSWSVASRRYFESLVEDKVLVCQILSTGVNQTMLVNLFNTAEGRELDISQELIESGFAEGADYKITQPRSAIVSQSPCTLVIDLPG